MNQAAIDAANAAIVENMKAAAAGIIQGSDEWFAARCGKVTASRMKDMLAKARVPGEGMRVNYAWQLACERMTGKPGKTYQNKVMEEAHEWEPIAREAYSMVTGFDVTEVGFVDHPNIAMAGASPDGLVIDPQFGRGLIQIKCPFVATHITALVDEKVATEYQKQMTWECACARVEWCDFVSYNHDMDIPDRLAVLRFRPGADAIQEMEAAVRAFQVEVEANIARVKSRPGR